MQFNFYSPAEIQFGWGSRHKVGKFARKLGKHARIVLGSRQLAKSLEFEQLCESLEATGISAKVLTTISQEPEVGDVDRTTRTLLDQKKNEPIDFLIAVGGGSAIDLAKAVSAMATNHNGDSVSDYLEGVGRDLKLESPPLPVIAIPTTAGTGSEVTKNAVISSYDPPFKKSLRSEQMIPKLVLVDPELTVSVPAETTAFSGMDAITQCIESYLSLRSQPISRALAFEGARLGMHALENAVRHPDSRSAREEMACCALMSGLALANSGLGMAHGVAAALGVHCRVPHGLACAVMLPTALEVNREVSEQRIVELAEFCGYSIHGKTHEHVCEEFIRHIRVLAAKIEIPTTLGHLGVRKAQLPAIVKSSRGNSMNGNPRELTDQELHEILERML